MRLRHLLKTTVLTALLLIAGKVGWGQVLLGENFSYSTGQLTSVNSGANVSGGNWVSYSGTSLPLTVTSGSLTYTNYYSSGIDNKVDVINGSAEDAYCQFTTQVVGSKVYAAFLMNVTTTTGLLANTSTTGDYTVSFLPSTSTSALVGRVSLRAGSAANTFNVGMRISSSNTPAVWKATDYPIGTPILVALSYEIISGNTNDIANLWINPAIGVVEPAADLTQTSALATDPTDIARITIRQGTNSFPGQLDGIRVATTWAGAVKINTDAPAAIFNPANAATGVDIISNLAINFDAPIVNTDGSVIADPTSLITLKETDGSGADVAFTATINSAKNQITIDPTASLKTSQLYYIGVAAVKDNYANTSVLQTATFTTRAIGTTATVSSTTYTVNSTTWKISMIPADVPVATFESNINSVTGSTFAAYDDVFNNILVTGNVMNGDTLKVTSEDGTTLVNKYTLVVTPTLTADITDNNVDNNIVITYPADPAWFAAAGTVVKDGTTTLVVTTDYTLTDGVLTLIPTATNSLKTPGSRTITVTKTGYAPATVTQVINAGAPTANSTASISPALGLGATSTVTLTAKDQFSNLVSGYTFKYDVAITDANPATAEVYTVDGSAAVTATDVAVVTATNASGVATFDIVMPAFVDGGDGISLQTQLSDGTTSIGSAISYVAAPALTADITDNNIDNSIVITFTDVPAWRAAPVVKDGATTLTETTDYTFAAGELTLIPLATNSLGVAGSRTITVVSAGFSDATVTQVINPGAPTAANSLISNSPAMGLGVTSTVTLTAKDKYDNLVPGYVFKYDATVTNLDPTIGESYTINGTATTADASDVALTATADPSGVTTFDIVVPATVDGGDGVSVQVQLNDGITDKGTAIAYSAPTVPALAATASLIEVTLNGATINVQVLNETFADATLDKANFTLNNAPTGLSVSDVAYLTDKTATVTLAYVPTDFDVDVTNLSVTVDGSEFTLAGTLTSNDLTVTATIETPVVTTNAAITTPGITTATWGGDVTADGGQAVTQKGICWSTTADPTILDSKTLEGAGIGAITGSMTDLLANTQYHVRAYASNSDLTAYGADQTFTTNLPTITLDALTDTLFYSGDEIALTWTSEGVIDVKIELYNGTTYSTLNDSSPNDGAHTVTIPIATATGAAYRIRISDVDNSSITSESVDFDIVHVTTIHDIQYPTDILVSDASTMLGQVVTTAGVVTGIKIESSGKQSVYMQNGDGQWNALYAYGLTATPVIAIGDKIVVTGTVYEYNKLTELSPVTAFHIVSNGNAVPNAVELTTLGANDESYESALVKVTNAAYVSSSAVGTYQVSDGTGNVQIYKGLFPTLTLAVANTYTITGFLGQYTAYQIMPRNAADIINNTATVTSTVYTVGATDITNIPYSATYAEFEANILFPTGSTHEFFESDGSTPATTMVTGNILTITAEDGVTFKSYTITRNLPLSGNDITAFSIGAFTGIIADPNISVEVAFSDNLASLIATFTLSTGATATVSTVDQVSGTTVNDFTSAVTYVVKAEDGTTKDWIVTVTKAATAETGKDILTFTIAGVDATVTVGTHTVTATVSANTDVTALVATFTLSPLATAKVGTTPQISGTTPNDFTNAVVYTITAEDLSVQDWTVTITKAIPSSTELFFSEYVEGSGYNKAFEIYNPGATAVDLSEYTVKVSNNGVGFGKWAGMTTPVVIAAMADTRYVLTFPVGTMIAPGDVYVVYDDGAVEPVPSVGDLKLTYFASAATDIPTILAENASHPAANVASFNGNDALALYKGTTLVDVFGGEFITTNFDVAGNAGYGADHSIVRKPAVHAGNPDWTSSTGTNTTNSEWIVNALDDFTNLGSHTMDPITSGPTITTSTATLTDFGGVQKNTTSGEKSFSVSGTSLTADVVITAPAGFEISLSSGILFSSESPITLTRTLGAVSETLIYVRFAPTAALVYADNITVTSAGATEKLVAVSGTGLATGINENWDSNLSIYPNPFTNEIKFEGIQNVNRVMITNIIGQVLKNFAIGQDNFVNTQDLIQGIYIITLVNDKGEKSIHKMIKK